MQCSKWVLFLSLVVATGCKYETPLSDQHDVPVDSTLLGLWHQVPDADEAWKEERLLILKYSETEYLIHYPAQDDGLYYRGYGIDVGGISCVQLQIIGVENGPPPADDEDLYHVVLPRLVDGQLEVSLLNTDVVDENLTESGALRQAFLASVDRADLFVAPLRFVRPGARE